MPDITISGEPSVNITVGGSAVPVYLGENTAAAHLSALQAAISAATAEAAAGPNYASTAAGLAATANGEAFAVDNGDGTVTVYLNNSGTAVAQRTLATTAYFAASGGAALVGTSTGVTVEARLAANDTALANRYTKAEADTLILNASYDVADGPRDVTIYAGAQSVKVARRRVVMGGFRYLGHYSKSRAPEFAMPASRVASLSTGQAALSATKAENWYAVFAVANDGDAAAQLVVMPFLRIATPSGLACPLIPAGEGVHDLVTTTSYSWTATNNLAGTECLVISGGGGWLGRVSTITANSASSISLDSVANLAAGDFLLPAPPGYDHYCYLGSFYRDTAEVRNIYDSGSIVTAKMIAVSSPNIASGAFASPTEINVRGYISPLATAVLVQSQVTISTASTGDYAEYFDGDSGNHTLDTKYVTKVSTSSQTVVWPITTAPFLYHQSYWWSTAGGIAASRAGGAHLIVGWIEP